MIERIDGMPAGTIGLRASGKLSMEDYTGVLEPALHEGVDSGELRLLFVLTDYEGLESGVWIEDAKTGLRSWVRDHSAWKRFALVTDVESPSVVARMPVDWSPPVVTEVLVTVTLPAA